MGTGRLLLMGGLGYTFDAMDAQAVSFILPPVAKLFNLSDGQTGLLGSSVLAIAQEKKLRDRRDRKSTRLNSSHT